jgi:hypothetical protein
MDDWAKAVSGATQTAAMIKAMRRYGFKVTSGFWVRRLFQQSLHDC